MEGGVSKHMRVSGPPLGVSRHEGGREQAHARQWATAGSRQAQG